tara:strand:+ start:502 stop:747 length:246 start_codon:yes stop_codon:yes gene_type:complete
MLNLFIINAKALYMLPEFKWYKLNFLATSLDKVPFPEAAGPSIAITRLSFSNSSSYGIKNVDKSWEASVNHSRIINMYWSL